jgi:hypothetical protein
MAYKGIHIPELVAGLFDGGNPLASGKVFIYDVGTVNEKTVYDDVACTKADTSADVNVFTYDDLGLTPDGSILKISEVDAAGVYLSELVDGTQSVVTKPKIVHEKKGTDVASATALTPTFDGNYFDVTGTTQIESIATSGVVGTKIKLHFDSALTIQHHATNLVLPGSASTADKFKTIRVDETGVAYKLVDEAFIGSVCMLTADLTASSNVSFLMTWGTDIVDTHAFHDPSSNPSRFTIPTTDVPMRKGRVSTNITFAVPGTAASFFNSEIYLVTAASLAVAKANMRGNDGVVNSVYLQSPPCTLSAGDYFEIRVDYTGTAENIISSSYNYIYAVLEILS